MNTRIVRFLRQLSLAQQFMLASLAILIAAGVGIAAWLGRQIEDGVIHRTAATTALYLDSFVAPNLQELGQSQSLTPEHVQALSSLLKDTPLGQQIVTLKVWDPAGRVLYSTDASAIGQTFPVRDVLQRASQGEVIASISSLDEAENAPLRAVRAQLLETYSPIRLNGSNRIIAVAEFYQTIDDLQREVAAAQQRSWLVVGGAMLLVYLALAGFVRRASDTIDRQQGELAAQVVQLRELLARNQELHARVQRAAASVATLNERFLRRIGAELHDGPAQDLSLALLRLDTLAGRSDTGPAEHERQLADIESALQRALQEVRGISSGLTLPQLADLSPAETVLRAARAHERRTGTRVEVHADALPEQISLPVKITLYRFIQEGLNNAYRHAGGTGQQVRVGADGGHLSVAVSDQGPGFDPERVPADGEHIGLAGMRERVESLGGTFAVESGASHGTCVRARLPLRTEREGVMGDGR